MPIFLLVFSSCSNDNNQEDSAVNDSVLLKKAVMKNGASTDFFEYSYDGKKLARISYDSGNNDFSTFTYNGDVINGSKRFGSNNDLLFERVYEYDSKQRMISLSTVSEIHDYGDKTVFVYNSDGTISFKKYLGDFVNQTKLDKTGKIWLNAEGETMIVEEYQDSVLLSKTEFTYDDKNNTIKNIVGFNKIFLLGEQGKIHNILTCKKFDSNNFLSYSYSNRYTYNSANFPVSVITTFEDGSVGSTEWVYY
jgi:hypothetical protein